LPACFFQLDSAAQNLDDIRPRDQVVNEVLGYQSGHDSRDFAVLADYLIQEPSGGRGVPGFPGVTGCAAKHSQSGADRQYFLERIPAVDDSYRDSCAFTLALTAPMSARPWVPDLRCAMTLPMSRMLVAPVSAMLLATI